jgi:hypothetical protein
MTENRRRRVIAHDDSKWNVDNHAKNLDHNDDINDSDEDEYEYDDDDDDDDDSDYDSQYDEDEDDGDAIGQIIAKNEKNDDDDVSKITNVIEVEPNVIKSNNDSSYLEQQLDNNRKERNYRRVDKDVDPTVVWNSCNCSWW